MNRLMKQHARKLYQGQMGLLYLAAATCLLLGMGVALLPDLLVDLLPVYPGTLLPILLSLVVLGPLNIGFVRICYQIYLGQDTGFGQLFYFFSHPSRYTRAVGVVLIRDLLQQLLVPLTQLVTRLGTRAAETYHPMDLALTLGAVLGLLALTGFGIFWMLRMLLLPYLLTQDESAGVGHLLRESFRLMGGNGGRYFLLLLGFLGYYLLLALAYGIASTIISLTLGTGNPLALITLPGLLESVALTLLQAILLPYLTLTLVAFADTILSGRMVEVRYRAALGGRFLTWEQLHWAMSQGIPPTGGPTPPGRWSGPDGGPVQPFYPPPPPPPPQPYDARQHPGQPQGIQDLQGVSPQELQAQQNAFLLGRPMTPRGFFASTLASSYHDFPLVSLLPASGVYPFLGQNAQLLELVNAAWQACRQEMNPHPRGTGHRVRRQEQRLVGGTPIRATATLQEQQDGTGYQVGLGVELSPQE